MWAILAVLVVGSLHSASAAIAPAVFNQTATNTTILAKPIGVAAVAVTVTSVAFVNSTATTVSPRAQLTVVDYFVKVIRGELTGARKCKKDHDCGAGLKCNLLWNWCAPFDAPVWPEYTNNCTSCADCSDLYYCSTFGKCRIAGPRRCLTNLDCADGGLDSKNIYDCVDTEDLEKRTVILQLGRPVRSHNKADAKKTQKKHEHHHEVEIESEEVAQFGATAEGDHLTHGKRCWSRCTIDTDCATLRFPAFLVKENFGCCNGYCTRRQSCVSVPLAFRATTIAPAVWVPILAVQNKTAATTGTAGFKIAF